MTFTYTITRGFTDPFFTGTSANSPLVPHVFDCALGGRPFLIDTTKEFVGPVSIQLLRDQADDGARPGENSLSRDELWRRTIISWHRGAGQTYGDREDSDPYRFRSSKGIDPWTRYSISLLPDTAEKRDSANTNLRFARVGDALYLADGSDIVRTTDITADTPTWAEPTGWSENAVVAMASDGTNLYASDSANIYTATASGNFGAAWSTSEASLLAYAKGRLIGAGGGANDHILYEWAADGTATAFFTPTNTAVTWTAICDGPNAIYAASVSGDKSSIYATGLKSDATALDAPIVAGELPEGEVVRGLCSYLGFMVIGTDRGFRIATVRDDTTLAIGSLVNLGVAVRCFEPQERWVWFGWTNYDATSTGLGRIDLSQIVGDTAAYATDLMATEQGNVLDVCTFNDVRVFAVSGEGVYAQTTDLVASGTLDTGLFSYGIPDEKIMEFVRVNHEALEGTVAVSISTGGTFASLDTSSDALTTAKTMRGGETLGVHHEARLTLTRHATDDTTGPTVTALTFHAYPAPNRGEVWVVPLMLGTVIEGHNGQTYVFDPEEELFFVRSWASPARQLITWQFGNTASSVFVEEYRNEPEAYLGGGKWRSVCTVRLKAPAEVV